MKTSDVNFKMAQRFRAWLEAQRYAQGTTVNYTKVAHLFCAFLSDGTSLRDVRPMHISEFLTATTSREYPGVVSDRLGALRCFFDFLYFGGVIDNVPPRFIHARRRRRGLPHILTQAQVAKLIAAADPPRDCAVIEVLYATGCRSCELRSMRVEDLDFANRQIRVRGKGKDRTVYFGSVAARMLRTYLAKRRTGYVFQNAYPDQRGWITCSKAGWYGSYKDYSDSEPALRHQYLGRPHKLSRATARAKFEALLDAAKLKRRPKDRPLYKSTLARIVGQAATKAHLTQVTPRTLRHCFATHLLERGADILEVQQLLGHAHLSSTQIYTRISNRKLVQTYRRLHPRGR